MTPMTDAEMALYQRVCDDATEGPWHRVESPWLPPDVPTYVIAGSPDPHGGRLVCDFQFLEDRDEEHNDWNDAEFIAVARTAMPRLLATVAALRAELAAMTLARDTYRDAARNAIDAGNQLRAELARRREGDGCVYCNATLRRKLLGDPNKAVTIGTGD